MCGQRAGDDGYSSLLMDDGRSRRRRRSALSVVLLDVGARFVTLASRDVGSRSRGGYAARDMRHRGVDTGGGLSIGEPFPARW